MRQQRSIELTRAALVAIAALACRPPDPDPLPRIVSAAPQGTGIPPDGVVVEITFSERVDPAGLADGRYLGLALESDLRAVSTAAGRAEGLGPDDPVVPADARVSDDGLRAELRPRSPLAPSTAYAAVVSSRIRSASGRPVLDPEGRQRTFASLFETGPLPDREPPTPRWIEPPQGPVPANVARLRIGFSEPVSGALELASAPDAAPVAPAPDVLGLDLRTLLPPGPLALSLAGVRDAAGNPSAEIAPLEVATCTDALPPVIDEATVAVDAAELGVAVAASADEPSRLGVELSAVPGEPACGALPAAPGTLVAWGDLAACPGADPCAPAATRCRVAAAIRGLCPGRRVRVRLAAEDVAGNRSAFGAWRDGETAAPVPRPVVTEVLVDAAAPEAAGECVEVANIGTGDASLEGWTLAKRTASGTLTRCAMTGAAIIPPGAHALIVGGTYDGRYQLAGSVPLYRCGATSLLGGLSNDHPPAILLYAPDGSLASSLGAEAALRCTSKSVERIHPAGPDTASNLACSTAGLGTPAACNSTTPLPECPAKPW